MLSIAWGICGVVFSGIFVSMITPGLFVALSQEEVELRNQADSIIYQTRRTLKEAEEKLDERDVEPVEAKLGELEELITKDGEPLDIDDIDEATIQTKVKELEETMHAISAKLYEAAAANMQLIEELKDAQRKRNA